jgi:hypothetical protein
MKPESGMKTPSRAPKEDSFRVNMVLGSALHQIEAVHVGSSRWRWSAITMARPTASAAATEDEEDRIWPSMVPWPGEATKAR